MLKAVLIAALALAALLAQGQKEDPKYKITPTKTTKYGAQVYVPADLEDSFKELDKMLSKALREEMRKGKEDDMNGYHFGLGMWMRNEWGLWKGLRLAKWFNKQGIHHPDDMSGIILTSYWRRMNKKPLDLQKQIKFYQDYWKKAGEEQKKEEARVKVDQAKIKKMILGLELQKNSAPEVEFKGSLESDHRVVYAAPFEGGVLVGVRQWNRTAKDWAVKPYFMDLADPVLKPFAVRGLEKVEDVVVVQGKAYAHGKAGDKETLMSASGSQVDSLPLPEGGPFRLGVDEDGAKALLLVGKRNLWRWWGGKWEAISIGKATLPNAFKPAMITGGRLYIRDNGSGENEKRRGYST